MDAERGISFNTVMYFGFSCCFKCVKFRGFSGHPFVIPTMPVDDVV
jgi:hypothetical protein